MLGRKFGVYSQSLDFDKTKDSLVVVVLLPSATALWVLYWVDTCSFFESTLVFYFPLQLQFQQIF